MLLQTCIPILKTYQLFLPWKLKYKPDGCSWAPRILRVHLGSRFGELNLEHELQSYSPGQSRMVALPLLS